MRASTSALGGGTTVVRFEDDGEPISRAYALARLADDDAFRTLFAQTLAALPYAAFFWETPPTTRAQLGDDFECVVIDAPPLARVRADATDFEARFAKAGGAEAIAFPNLGGDALLVVPTPKASASTYAHLASFLRGAPKTQIDALLRLLGKTIDARLSAQPTWVSTAGLGVSWLHVRLDARPKYYRHEPYKRAR